MDDKKKFDQTAYIMEYNKTHYKQFKINLNKQADIDIIRWLDGIDNKQGYIKRLIRKDMGREKLL